jgi:hypothetical protein
VSELITKDQQLVVPSYPLRDRVLVLHRGRLQLQLGRVPAVLAHVLGRCWLVDV